MVYFGGHKMCNILLSECNSLGIVGQFQILCTFIRSALEKLAKKLWKCQNSRSFVMPLKGNFRVSDSIFDFKLGTKGRTLNSKLKTRHSKENSAKERPLMSYWSLLFLMFSKDVHIEVSTLQNKGK